MFRTFARASQEASGVNGYATVAGVSVGSLGTGASVVGLLAWLDKIAQKGDVVRIDLYSREKMQPTIDRKILIERFAE